MITACADREEAALWRNGLALLVVAPAADLTGFDQHAGMGLAGRDRRRPPANLRIGALPIAGHAERGGCEQQQRGEREARKGGASPARGRRGHRPALPGALKRRLARRTVKRRSIGSPLPRTGCTGSVVLAARYPRQARV